jgi:hypothetical protein
MFIVIRRGNLRRRVHGPWRSHSIPRAPRRPGVRAAGIVVALLLGAGTAAANGSSTEDSCLACHAAIPQDSKWQHSYRDWQDSLHANVNVDCHSCHGGDSHAADAKEAHRGMVPVGGPDTPETRLMAARLCGACHPDKYWAFSHSRHYQRLQEGKPAAYCHTCHTAVGSRVLTPQTIAATCSRCHGDEAQDSIPHRAQDLLTRLYKVRLAATFHDANSKLTADQWKTVAESATAAMAAWHEFDLAAVDRALARGTALVDR